VSYVSESQACGGVAGGGGVLLEHGGGVDQGGGVVAAGGGGGAGRNRGGVSPAGEPRVAISFFARAGDRRAVLCGVHGDVLHGDEAHDGGERDSAAVYGAGVDRVVCGVDFGRADDAGRLGDDCGRARRDGFVFRGGSRCDGAGGERGGSAGGGVFCGDDDRVAEAEGYVGARVDHPGQRDRVRGGTAVDRAIADVAGGRLGGARGAGRGAARGGLLVVCAGDQSRDGARGGADSGDGADSESGVGFDRDGRAAVGLGAIGRGDRVGSGDGARGGGGERAAGVAAKGSVTGDEGRECGLKRRTIWGEGGVGGGGWRR